MKVQFVTVSFHSQNNIQRAISSFSRHFPEERLLVVDNNPLPEQVFKRRTLFNWVPNVDDERNWLKRRQDIIIIRPNIEKIDVPLFHGDGLNCARKWCLRNGYDAMCHFEPDCLIRGRDWYIRLRQGIDRNWMCGLYKRAGHGIAPCPCLWMLEPTKHIDFNVQPKRGDVNDLQYEELVGPKVYAKDMGQWAVEYFKANWDMGGKLWFECAIRNKAAYKAPSSDFTHLWNGSIKNAKKHMQFKLL